MQRFLDQAFQRALTDGPLVPMLRLVRRDHTLDLQIRQNEVHIYYRGGRIARIAPSKGGFSCKITEKYFAGGSEEARAKGADRDIRSKDDASLWVEECPGLKQVMDFWFARKQKNEREFQQLLVRENNYSNIADGTDYFIVDIEYAETAARCDCVAIRWDSVGAMRKLPKGYRPRLALLEMKYGDGALAGKSGIQKHLDDMDASLARCEDLKRDAVSLFKQKRALGLVPALNRNRNHVMELDDRPEIILLIANHDPAKSGLMNTLAGLRLPKHADLKFARANFLGYGLYADSFQDLQTFQASCGFTK